MDRRNFLASSSKTILGGIALSHSSAPLFAEAPAKEDGTTGHPRKHVPLDADWKFFRGDTTGGEGPSVNDHSWQLLDLPHDWSIAGPFREDDPSGPHEGYLPCGIGWYRKEFALPSSVKDKHLEIEFDGVYMNSDVWLNGHHLGHRPYGYVSFAYDLTPYLRSGGQKNVLAVRVDNSGQPNSRWYTGSGIYRHVWLTLTDSVRVDTWGTFVRTPTVSSQSSSVDISTRIRNGSDQASSVRLVTEIQDPSGSTVSHFQSDHDVPAAGEYTFEQSLTIANPQLWSVDKSDMYTAVSRVYVGSHLVDEYQTPFGVRSFAFDANTGFSLNGEGMKLKGVCIHHDLGALGAAFNDSAMERRLRILKDMGCNAIRMSHNPPAPQLLDMCDRMGFLVMDEAFDEWKVGKAAIKYGYHLYFDQWAKADLTSMIVRDRNHPSIILWSVGNEIPEKNKPEGVESAKWLAEIVRSNDSTRPVTCAISQIESANKSGFAEVFDVVGYNGGGGSNYNYDADHKNYPTRKIYGSEAPHTAQTRGVYVSDENYFSSYDTSHIRMSSEGHWKMVQDRPFVAGAFRWAGIDYLGEPTPHKSFHTPYRATAWPARSGDFGVIDTCGFEKDTYYFYQSQWSTKPMLHILPHWNWEGMEGKPIFVWCYTNCDSVELFLNERSLGVQRPISTAGYHLTWEVPYAPGTLRAVGKRGTEVCRQEISTAGSASDLVLNCDRNVIRADGHDLTNISVSVVDSKGSLVPNASNLIHFDVKGEGVIVGVDNGDPLSHQSLKGRQITAFHAKCLV
ncbi:MAG: glycoside hydrolase family 2 TIM barrel-domain containing protein, partial [Bryocella sp.]